MSQIVLPDGMAIVHGMWWPDGCEQLGESPPELGLCCCCDQRTARVLAGVNRQGVLRGEGWGCMQCQLPANGLQVVLCLACLQESRPVLYGCCGFPAREDRWEIGDFEIEFEHRLELHPELQGDAHG